MKSSFMKIKKLLSRTFRAQGFVSKYKCLKRRKWLFLKGLKSLPTFFNAIIFFSKSQRNSIKASFKLRKNLIHQGKLFFLKSKTRYLKQLFFRLSLHLKRTKQLRTLKLTNLTERRLLVLLMRSGFFNRVRFAAVAVRRGEVFVNERKILRPFFPIRLGSIVFLKGKSRKFALNFGVYQLAILHQIKKIIPRSFLSTVRPQIFFSHLGLDVKKRARQCLIFQSLVVELFFLEDFLVRFTRGQQRIVGSSRFQKFRSVWPADFARSDIPPYLIVDYQAMSLCVKNAVDIPSMTTVSKQYLPPINFWKF